MKHDAPSRTAQFVAAARSLGRLLPQHLRLADDPYGTAFSTRRLEQLPFAKRLATLPGLGTWVVYMQVRTKVIDDALRAWLAGGGRQVVVLGAGYDCRALRMPELAAAHAEVYEVDHPATQAHKQAVLARLGTHSPAHYVTWDFEARPMDDLPDALADAGLDRSAPVFTIWEGVTMYLTEPAIDASLRAIRAWSPPGSELAMTYHGASRLAHPSLPTRAVQLVVGVLGEPWKWGWIPDELPAYLAARGLTLVDDVSTPEAARALFPTDLASLVRVADSRIARARTHV